MRTSIESNAILQCHPATPCGAVDGLRATVHIDQEKRLSVTYILEGMIEQLRIPMREQTAKAEPLWRHTCFELFIGAQNDTEYYEFNFSPCGAWAAYAFHDYRSGGRIDTATTEPKISVRQNPGMLELQAIASLEHLPGLQFDVSLWLGISAVVEERSGALSYWALKHPVEKPDFHHPDSFAVHVTPPAGGADAIRYNSTP
jgi:hypothetical protein